MPGIGHPDQQGAGSGCPVRNEFGMDRHASRRRELDRISDQVQNHLAQSLPVEAEQESHV